MDHEYFKKTKPDFLGYQIWMSDDLEPIVDTELPRWAQPGHIEYKTEYIFNNVGLRCDDFTKEEPNNHIIFAGDEITLAQDIDLEKGWANIVYKNIEPEGNSFRNLAYPGASPAKIISNLFKYFNHYGNPKTICLLMPELIRHTGVMPEYGVFKPKMYRQYKNIEPKQIEHNLMAEPHDFPIHLLGLTYLQQVRYLEQYCFSNDINLHWTTWDYSTMLFLKNYKHRYFFEIDMPKEENVIWDGSFQKNFAQYFIDRLR
jgi:hypothetical protein